MIKYFLSTIRTTQFKKIVSDINKYSQYLYTNQLNKIDDNHKELRKEVDAPTAAFAEKYWAVIEKANPKKAIPIITKQE